MNKEYWREAAICLINKQPLRQEEKNEIFYSIDVLLGLDENEFRNCGMKSESEKVDDKLALAGVEYLVAGLVGTLGLVFPPCYAAAGAIATHATSVLADALQEQSELNRLFQQENYRKNRLNKRPNISAV